MIQDPSLSSAPDIFISYSRKDIAFARLIREALISSGFSIWIDWERIPAGVEWWKTIVKAINDSKTFLFIISKTSIGSSVCKDEITEALRSNKRIIPVIVDDLSPEVVGEFVPDLRKINWIIFQRERFFHIQVNPEVQSDKPEDREVALPGLPQFEQTLEKLSREIHTDWEWVTEHTHLQSAALEWDARGREISFLLRGAQLEEAERLLLAAAGKDPQPTLVQSQFVTASRQEETQRQAAARALEQKAARRQRRFLWAVGVGAVIAFALMLLFLNQRDQYLAETFVRATAEANAIEQRNAAQNRQLAAQALNTAAYALDSGLLLAVEAARASKQADVQHTILEVLQLSPNLQQYIPGNPRGFNQIAISPDGTLLAAGTTQNSVVLYELSTGKPLGKPLTGPPSEVTAVAFSPDGRTLAAVCNDPLIFFWNMTNLAQPSPLPTLPLPMYSQPMTISINSDGKIFTTWTGRWEMGLSGLWGSYGDTPPDDVRLHTHGAFSVSYSPDGALLAVGAGDATVRLLNITTGKWYEALPLLNNIPNSGTQPGVVMALKFSQDGRILAASSGSVVRAWDVAQNKIVAQRFCMTGPSQLYLPTTLDAAGKRLVYSCNTVNPNGSINPTLRIIDLTTNQDAPEQILPATLLSLSFGLADQPDVLALGTTENHIVLWNTTTGQPVGEALRVHQAEISSLRFTPDGLRLITSDWNHNIAVWQLDPTQQINRISSSITLPPEKLTFSDQVSFLAFDRAGKQLFASRYIGAKLYSVDPHSSQLPRIAAAVEEPSAYIRFMAYIPAIHAIAWVESTGKVVLVDASNHATLRTFLTTTPPPNSSSNPLASANTNEFAFDSANARLAEALKGEVRLWNLKDGQLLAQKLTLADTTFSSMIFSPDGSLLAMRGKKGSSDTLYLWQPSNGKTISMPLTTGAGNGGLLVAIAPDNQHFAYSRLDKSFYLCNLSSGAPVCHPGGGNTTWITDLKFNHAGSVLASLATDGSLLLWDESGTKIGNLPAPDGYFNLEWSPDDQRLALSGFSGTLVILDAALQPWSAAACLATRRNLNLIEWQTYFAQKPYHKTCPDLPIHASIVEYFLVRQTNLLAQNQMDKALQTFGSMFPIDPALLPELKTAAAAYPSGALAARAAYLANRDAPAALESASMLKNVFPTQQISSATWNTICWFTSLNGQAAKALPFCEIALQLDPGNPSYLDSRGLARALTGDLSGASADFKAYVEYSRNTGSYEPYGRKREGWIIALEKGQNPFDAALLEALKKE